MNVVAVVQARTGSTRLPGKVLAEIDGMPLVAWTLAAFRAVASIDEVVLATTTGPEDDELAAIVGRLGPVHRGPARDVLTRIWDAAAPYEPDLLVRGTADNPFPDPDLVARQVELCAEGRLDYVGGRGWPLGIVAEVARMDALAIARREAGTAAEREHVMPFLYSRPERFRLGVLDAPGPAVHPRYTVDTAEDLRLARELAIRIGHGPPVRLAELEAIMRATPALQHINVGIRQKTWQEAEES